MAESNNNNQSPERAPRQPDCPREITAEHANGRKVQVLLDDPHLIGRGSFGVIYAVRAKVVGMRPQPEGEPPFTEKRRAYEFRTVVKVFYGERGAQVALSLYDVCKTAGLLVPPTYRADFGKRTVIMTDLRIDDSYVVSGNPLNWSIGSQALTQTPLECIANWDAVLSLLFSKPAHYDAAGHIIGGSEVYKATAYEIELQPDVYFFKTKMGTASPEVAPFAGDFDIVQHPAKKNPQALLRHNVTALSTMCKLYVEHFVTPERQKEHLDRLYSVCQETLNTARE